MENLKDVAHIAGRPGLFKIVKPGRSGVIVESLDDAAKKEIVSVNAKVSVLKDISIYSTDFNKSTPLGEIFTAIKEKHGDQIDLNVKDLSKEEFFDFFEEIMPDFDKERVYPSDVKKIIQWYNTLSVRMPELFVATEETQIEEGPNSEEKEAAPTAKKEKKAAEKKPAAKKKPASKKAEK
jgi:hypothetical protein